MRARGGEREREREELRIRILPSTVARSMEIRPKFYPESIGYDRIQAGNDTARTDAVEPGQIYN